MPPPVAPAPAAAITAPRPPITPRAVTSPPSSVATASTAAATRDTATPSEAAISPTLAQEPALPGISQLPPDKRGAMPPLKMSMHVWSEQPPQRFAIIDGQRVGEGARVPGGVVAEIRRDGVVLDVDGNLYLLPRP